MGGLRFTGDWRTTAFVVLMVPLLASLGFWQLSRAEEKQAITREFEGKQSRPPALLGELDLLDARALAYQPVQMSGRFMDEYFLLDNRMVQGRYGNDVIGVFEDTASGVLVLVNRGWIVADAARRSLPEAPAVEGEVRLTGQVYVAPGKPYLLQDEALSEGWPKRIQAVQLGKIAAALGVGEAALFPYPVRIASGAPGALYVDWPVVNVSPAKHYGYAVQWFAMAFVLAVLYLLRSTNILALLRGESN
ncbi:MAG: hypothetical protein Hals2KO_32830 [Halioglobus sp.]